MNRYIRILDYEEDKDLQWLVRSLFDEFDRALPFQVLQEHYARRYKNQAGLVVVSDAQKWEGLKKNHEEGCFKIEEGIVYPLNGFSRPHMPIVRKPQIEEQIRHRIREGLSILKRLDLEKLTTIVNDYETCLAADPERIMFAHFELMSCTPETIMGALDDGSKYIFHYSSLVLEPLEFATIMAHEGMEKFGSWFSGRSLPKEPINIRHLTAVVFDRQVSQTLTGDPFMREQGIKRVCAHYGLKSPLGLYDERKFKVEGDKVIFE